MLTRTLVLKVMNNGRKFLTDREIIDRIAKQIESLRCAIEILDSSELTTAKFHKT